MCREKSHQLRFRYGIKSALEILAPPSSQVKIKAITDLVTLLGIDVTCSLLRMAGVTHWQPLRCSLRLAQLRVWGRDEFGPLEMPWCVLSLCPTTLNCRMQSEGRECGDRSRSCTARFVCSYLRRTIGSRYKTGIMSIS